MSRSDSRPIDGPAVLVPVKAFGSAKVRLQPALSPAERVTLVRDLAAGVLAAAAPLPVWVACDDREVADWARSLGASVAWTEGLGLNGAVETGRALLTACGASEVVVSHADLPLPDELASVTGFDGVTLVPDRRADGTNVVAVPRSLPFVFSYGAGSFRRHEASAAATGAPVRVLRSTNLAWDLDLPADLRDFAART